MGKVVDKRESMSVKELVVTLAAGYAVSYEADGLVQVFPVTMKPHEAALKWAECRGGRFVVREMTKSA